MSDITIIKAEDFKFRNDLENYVRNKIGLTTVLKNDYSIHGTKQDLAKLQLGENSLFWGIRVFFIDKKGDKISLKKKSEEKPNRGKVYKSKLK